MELKALDHLVLTTQNLDACLHFYIDILGMRHIEQNGRHALAFGYQKINIHTQKGEFQPATVRFVLDRVVAIGAADMQARIYDPQNRQAHFGGHCGAYRRAGKNGQPLSP